MSDANVAKHRDTSVPYLLLGDSAAPMRTSAQVLIGVVPAVVFTFLFGLTYLGYVVGPLPVVTATDTLLITSGVLGTIGLIWSVAGYARKRAVLVILLLLVGIAGMGTFAVGVLEGLAAGTRGGRVSSLSFLGSLLLFAWFVVGPIAVGLLQVWYAMRSVRAVA